MNFSNDLWARAIHESTACLRVQRQQRQQPPHQHGRVDYGAPSTGAASASTLQSLDTSLAFLEILERQLMEENQDLENNEERWSNPPTHAPPSWTQYAQLYYSDSFGGKQQDQSSKNGRHGTSRNFDDGDNDDGGDLPNDYGVSDGLNGRRLLIRILTCQSEVLSSKANQCAAREYKDFRQGANLLQWSLNKIHEALNVADSYISRWWMEREKSATTTSRHSAGSREKDALVEDANIVEVAIESLTQRRAKMLDLCRQEENWLVRKLQPQWESRDQVKQRIGEDRWNNNPLPKNDYAAQRKEYEDRLRVVRQAIVVLQEMDPTAAKEKVTNMLTQLQTKLQSKMKESLSNHEHVDEEESRRRRYNGQRPTPEWLARRVDMKQYPDPSFFGWTFTGSWEAVEFFEKSVQENSEQIIVKFDWYFTTATIKTSLDHPTQGKTQLFGKPVTPELYALILKKPRVHTGNRYHNRQSRGGGGGNSRRGRGGRNNIRSRRASNARNPNSAILRPSQVPST